VFKNLLFKEVKC